MATTKWKKNAPNLHKSKSASVVCVFMKMEHICDIFVSLGNDVFIPSEHISTVKLFQCDIKTSGEALSPAPTLAYRK